MKVIYFLTFLHKKTKTKYSVMTRIKKDEEYRKMQKNVYSQAFLYKIVNKCDILICGDKTLNKNDK